MFYKDDYVTRKSYNNDIVFKILFLQHNIAILKGVDVRLKADAQISDLNKLEMTRNADENIDLPIKTGNYLNGKVLHIDGDNEYLKRSMKKRTAARAFPLRRSPARTCWRAMRIFPPASQAVLRCRRRRLCAAARRSTSIR